ncbi:MAG: tRNA (N6-threonylcarbamoyladenosine(37)-N6)-methyltransferase TrmO [Lentisphaeria bacterium]|nr:tRNA (N6-threonylcarbamoyladenosine(37)-N6)-methyltransferase TrmO [Lentisphaeria bacterium]
MNFTLQPIATIQSCYKEKFGIPRQPGLVKHALAEIILQKPYAQIEAIKELKDYSHIWVQFIFHQSIQTNWKATVRPPKMGGNKRVGVFATRSNFRPNPLGLSVVKLEAVNPYKDRVSLIVSGGDFLDGTPVVDIKPYLPYSDSIPGALSGLSCPQTIEKEIEFTEKSTAQLQEISLKHPHFKAFITELLTNDPRPGYKVDSDRIYGCHVYDYNLMWKSNTDKITITAIDPI